MTTMPVLPMETIKETFDPHEVALIEEIVKAGGVMKSSRPKRASGRAQFLWRSLVFGISPNPRHQCIPVTNGILPVRRAQGLGSGPSRKQGIGQSRRSNRATNSRGTAARHTSLGTRLGHDLVALPLDAPRHHPVQHKHNEEVSHESVIAIQCECRLF